MEEDSDEDSEKNNIILTKEKILELQAHNYIEIRNFIFSLPLYGSDVSLEKFRPTGDRYSASKITESLIKINISHFCQKIEQRIKKMDKNSKNIKFKNTNINKNPNNIESENSINTDNNLLSSKSSIVPMTSQINSSLKGEESNKGIASDSSSILSNIFKVNSIKYIQFLIYFLFIFTFLSVCIEFFVMYNHTRKLIIKINIFRNAYVIFDRMIYSKYYITEGVLGNTYPNYIGAKIIGENFFPNIQKKLSNYRQEITEAFNTLTSNELCQEYNDFMLNKKIMIYTLTINVPENITILFNTAINRIASSINELATNPSSMVITNRDTYELMYNLLNEYYISWEMAGIILYQDTLKATSLRLPLMLIIFFYFIISIIIIFVFIKLLSKLSLDREKPINLFLTIKKSAFENLKNSSENFSNKLLNKFFGNEDNDEDSIQDYQENIKSNDINIAKFKAANEYNYSIRKAFLFIHSIIIIFFFILFNLCFFIFKYFDFRVRFDKINNYLLLYDKINVAETDLTLSLNIFKSYLFNREIPILNRNNTKKLFIESFTNLTDKFEETNVYNSKSSYFLSEEYLNKYLKYFLGDFKELLDKNYYEKNKKNIENYINYGIKPIEIRLFEIIRFYTLKYCISDEINYEKYNNISFILKGNEINLLQINTILESVIENWYNGVIDLIFESLYEYENKTIFIINIYFIIFIVIIILYFCFVWKTNEEKLNNLLKESTNLIYLIPQEIKTIIIEKLSE